MGSVNSKPPSKHRKLKQSSMGQSITDDDTIGSMKIKKLEFIRLIAESLHSFGYKNTITNLEKESGIALSASLVTEFIKLVLDGNWDESLISLRKLSVLDESVVKSVSFVIFEQKFLELLNDNKVDDASRTLRTEISCLLIDQMRVRELSSLLLCSRDNVIKIKAKNEVVFDLQKLFPVDVMVPQGRLVELVEQALDSQQDLCSFHNSVTSDSLFSDHNCGRSQIPCDTLQILDEHQDEVFSHNGKFLASCSKDKSTILWKVGLDGRLVVKHRLLGHKVPVSCVSCVSWFVECNGIGIEKFFF